MAVDVILPKLGFSMTDGVVQEWLVADGGQVAEGAPLFLIESDKSAQEIESPASGRLRILCPAGERYDVGTQLAIVE